MAELRWIMTSSLVMLQVLSCTVTSVKTSSFTVRDEDEVMFPCESVIHDQKKCNSTVWLFSSSGSTVTLFEFGKFKEGANNRLDRLSVTEECSLVIKKVKGQDAGQYICRQFESGEGPPVGEIDHHLSVVDVTEEEEGDEVKLKCSVWTDGRCGHTVKWLKEGSHTEVITSHVCSASFSIKKDHYESLTCEVIDSQSGESHQFPFRRPQSGAFVTKTTNKPPVNETPEKKTTKSPPEDQKPVTAADDATKTTTKAKDAFVTKTTTSSPGNGNSDISAKKTTNKPPVNETPEKKTTKSPPEDKKPVTAALLRTFVVCLGSAALLISVVTVNIWTITKGKETRMEEIMQMDEVVEGDDSVNYVNVGEPSASVSLD